MFSWRYLLLRTLFCETLTPTTLVRNRRISDSTFSQPHCTTLEDITGWFSFFGGESKLRFLRGRGNGAAYNMIHNRTQSKRGCAKPLFYLRHRPRAHDWVNHAHRSVCVWTEQSDRLFFLFCFVPQSPRSNSVPRLLDHNPVSTWWDQDSSMLIVTGTLSHPEQLRKAIFISRWWFCFFLVFFKSSQDQLILTQLAQKDFWKEMFGMVSQTGR